MSGPWGVRYKVRSAKLLRRYSEISASYGLAVLCERHGLALQHRKQGKIQYGVRGKKAFPVTANGLLNFNIKGRSDVDKEFKKWKSKGAAEFSWSILNFLPEQDVRIKLGYEVVEKIPYLQIRENNWTFNADMSGRWNIRRCFPLSIAEPIAVQDPSLLCPQASDQRCNHDLILSHVARVTVGSLC